MKLVTIDLLYAIDTMPLRNRLFFSLLLASLFLSTAGLANSTCEDSFQAADRAARRSVLPPIDNAAVFITRDWWLKDYALELGPVLNLSPVDALEFVVRARIRPYELQTALGEGIGQHWSGTTRLDLARRISSAVTAAPDHFSGSGKYKVDEIKRLINALQQPSRLSINETIRAIQGLGYSSSIAHRIANRHPRFANEILAYSSVNIGFAQAKRLYRGLAVEHGLSGYSSSRIGLEWFSDKLDWAISFGGEKATALGRPLVVIEIEIPPFMHSMSPPQMGDMTWPILRAENFPDPAAPDLAPFLSRIGVQNIGESKLTFQVY
jgi:hypothetical protein